MDEQLKQIIDELDRMKPGDSESNHIRADRLLLDALRIMGHPEVAEAFEKADARVSFWYA